jgi:ubiquinone/menaquinone biosynthesis C-methylase UbiE
MDASIYDELSLWSSHFGDLLLRHLELRPGIEILDLGCGTGFPLFELAMIHGAESHVVGLDPWTDAIERARSRQEYHQLPNVTIVEGDGAAIPFPEKSFDLIVSNLGINNFTDPAAVLAECRRVIRPEGRIVITTNLDGHMRELYEIYAETLHELKLEIYLSSLEANRAHRGTVASHSALLESAGFRITRIYEEAFHMRYVDGTALLNHFLTRIGFLEGWTNVVNVADRQRVLQLLERKLNERAALDGELRMTIPMLYLEAEA